MLVGLFSLKGTATVGATPNPHLPGLLNLVIGRWLLIACWVTGFLARSLMLFVSLRERGFPRLLDFA